MLKRLRNLTVRKLFQIPSLRNLSDAAYEKSLQMHVNSLPRLEAFDYSIVDAVKNQGIFVTSLAEIAIPSSSLIESAAKSLLPRIPNKLSLDENEYVIHATESQVMEYPEIFLWGLEERLLDIAENYIGLPVAYHGMYFRRDIANNIHVKTRRWHIDIEDRLVFKIIVYLHDVTEDCGPFQYFPRHLTSSFSHALNYNGSLPDKDLKSMLSKSNCYSCLGAAGTVIFVDTGSIFHCGKIPVARDRYTLFFDYTSRRPKHPFYCKSSLPINDLYEISSSLSQRQKECIFWKETHS